MKFTFHPEFNSLPEGIDQLWEGGAAENVFLSRWWLETVAAAGLDDGDTLALGVLQSGDGWPLALLPARYTRRRSRPLRIRELASLTGMYAANFHPLVGRNVTDADVARSFGMELGNALARSDILHFDAMDADWPALGVFTSGLREAGFIVAQYDHFGNWYEELRGRSFDEYLLARDGAMRETLRRKARALAQKGASYEIVSGDDRIQEGLAAYNAVYSRSWKIPEPYPRFHERLIRGASRKGVLRLGICRIGDRPVAIQLWIVWRQCGTVLKLAHDEELKRLSPGTVLLGHMIRNLMQTDAVTEINFGRGDDSYKRLWTSQRRQRIGLIAANPRSATGLAVLSRHFAGRWLSSQMSKRPAGARSHAPGTEDAMM
jgi:hypothetical protein